MIKFLGRKEINEFIHSALPARRYVVQTLAGGLLNQNLLLTSGRQQLVLKVYRPEMPIEKVSEMHRVMEIAASHGMPVPTSITTAEINGFVVAVYPFLKGQNPKQFANSLSRIRAMGETLGGLHAIFDSIRVKTPKPDVGSLVAWHPQVFLEKIEKVQKVSLLHGKDRKYLAEMLDRRKDLMHSESWDNAAFLKLPLQLSHNDYHTKNILMVGNRVTAVLDWEKFGWHFRGFEIMRSIIFNCRKTEKEIDWKLAGEYVRAYRSKVDIRKGVHDLAYEYTYRRIVFDLWAVEQYLSHGRKELMENILRRDAMITTLTKHRKEYNDRVTDLLKN